LFVEIFIASRRESFNGVRNFAAGESVANRNPGEKHLGGKNVHQNVRPANERLNLVAGMQFMPEGT
jgi:hypothetical protein